jgi:hypothetical protein
MVYFESQTPCQMLVLWFVIVLVVTCEAMHCVTGENVAREPSECLPISTCARLQNKILEGSLIGQCHSIACFAIMH